MKFISLMLFGLFPILLNAQTNSDYDPRLLNHYSVIQLDDIRANDTVKFNTIVYYYTQSFTTEVFQCNGCGTQDTLTFDIEPYEYLRKPHERVTVKLKSGIILTLLATDELLYRTPIQQL